MTTANELRLLAKRCEAATGPERVLDADICEIVDLPKCIPPDCSPEVFRTIIARTREGGPWDQDPDCPFYTASIDAALTLVPEGWWRSIEDMDEGAPPLCRLERRDGKGEEVWSRAEPWPLAICAAALKARAQATKGE